MILPIVNKLRFFQTKLFQRDPNWEVTEEQILAKIHEQMTKDSSESNRLNRPVTVEVLNLHWFFIGGSELRALAILLSNLPTRFFSSRYITVMLSQFWDTTRTTIVYKQFLPFTVLVVFAILYYHRVLTQEMEHGTYEGDRKLGRIIDKIIGGCCLPLICKSLYIEYCQIKSIKDKKDYFLDLFNLFDIAGLFTAITIILLTLFELNWLSYSTLRMLASLSSLSLAVKFYDWLRVFEGLSFYVSLIGNTLNDIQGFIILFFIALVAFGLPLSMIDLDYVGDDGNQLIEPTFGHWFLDCLYN